MSIKVKISFNSWKLYFQVQFNCLRLLKLIYQLASITLFIPIRSVQFHLINFSLYKPKFPVVGISQKIISEMKFLAFSPFLLVQSQNSQQNPERETRRYNQLALMMKVNSWKFSENTYNFGIISFLDLLATVWRKEILGIWVSVPQYKRSSNEFNGNRNATWWFGSTLSTVQAMVSSLDLTSKHSPKSGLPS